MADSIRRFLKRVRLPENPLLRLLAVNGMIGVAISALVLAGIFAANIGNLRTLVLQAEDPVLPVVLLAIGLVITLGSVVMGSAIMLLPGDSKGGSGGRPFIRTVQRQHLQPAFVPAKAGRGRVRID